MMLNDSSESGATTDHKSTSHHKVHQVILMSFIIIISTAGNSLIVIAICRFRSLRTISNLIILNLSISDLLFSVTVAPLNVFILFIDKLTVFGPLCSFAGVIAELLCLVSIYTMVFISFERFLATNYPLKHRSIFTTNAVKIGLLVIWLIPTALCGATFLTPRYVHIENFHHCMLDMENSKEATMVLIHLGYFVPLLILVCCNVLIIKAVLKSRRFASEHAAASQRNKVGFCKEHQASLLTITIIVVFLFLWSPYFIVASSLAFKIYSLPKKVMYASLLLAMANTTSNPLIYGVMNKNFRIAFKKIIICKRN